MSRYGDEEIITPTPERIAKGDIIIETSDRGGISIRATRTFNDPLSWYSRNGHITSVQSRAGKRFYSLWFYGSVRSRHVVCRFDPIKLTPLDMEGFEEMQQAYHLARKAIRGVKEKRIAFRVCCEGEPAGRIGHGRIGRESGLLYLRSALTDLALHFGYS
jgi:hypothetical protein